MGVCVSPILGYVRGAVVRTPTSSCGKNVVVGTGARGLMEADFRTWRSTKGKGGYLNLSR